MAVLVAFKKLGHLASYAADVRWAPYQGVCVHLPLFVHKTASLLELSWPILTSLGAEQYA